MTDKRKYWRKWYDNLSNADKADYLAKKRDESRERRAANSPAKLSDPNPTPPNEQDERNRAYHRYHYYISRGLSPAEASQRSGYTTTFTRPDPSSVDLNNPDERRRASHRYYYYIRVGHSPAEATQRSGYTPPPPRTITTFGSQQYQRYFEALPAEEQQGIRERNAQRTRERYHERKRAKAKRACALLNPVPPAPSPTPPPPPSTQRPSDGTLGEAYSRMFAARPADARPASDHIAPTPPTLPSVGWRKLNEKKAQ